MSFMESFLDDEIFFLLDNNYENMELLNEKEKKEIMQKVMYKLYDVADRLLCDAIDELVEARNENEQ